MEKRYRLTRYGVRIGDNLTLSELRALMLTLSDNPTYQARVKNASCAIDNTYSVDSLRIIAADYETIGSVKECV